MSDLPATPFTGVLGHYERGHPVRRRINRPGARHARLPGVERQVIAPTPALSPEHANITDTKKEA